MATNPSSTSPATDTTTTATTTTTRITTATSGPNTSLSSSPTTNNPPFKSPVLVLGGTGTVGSRIAAQLAASNHPVVIASRSAPSSTPPSPPSSQPPSASPGNKSSHKDKSGENDNESTNSNIHKVHFDWEDRSTWSNPFDYIASLSGQNKEDKKPADISPYSTTAAERESIRAQKSKEEAENAEHWKIKSVYLIAPPGVLDAASVMMDFVDFARRRPESRSELDERKKEGGEGKGGGGVKRFVLQSASCIEPGGPAMGKVHGYFRELGSRGEIEWAVLRPSWFQQNFGIQENHIQSIRNEGKIYSATGDGKIPWISADDIAAVAVQALTMPVAPNTEFLILGPELLSYDDIATTLSEILGKKIVHVDLTSGDLEKRHRSFGMPEDYSSMMSALDTGIKYGMENRTNDVVLSVTGVAPKTFKEYAESVKHVWLHRGGGVDDLAGPTNPVDAVWANA